MTYAEGGFNPAKDSRRYKWTEPRNSIEEYISGRLDLSERTRAIMEATFRRLRTGRGDV